LIFDITFWFTMAVIVLPAALVYPDEKKIVEYFSLPTIWGGFVYLFIVLIVTHLCGNRVTLTSKEQRVANWFLMNGVFYNTFLDVFAGQFQMSGLLTTEYNIIEPRYKMGLYHDAGQVVFMTSMIELLIQAPLCIVTYWGYYHNASWRYVTGVIVSVLHFSGVWWMYIPEALRNFPHIPADRIFRFSFTDIVYYWFAFWFCGLLWTIIPFCVTVHLSRNISKEIKNSKN